MGIVIKLRRRSQIRKPVYNIIVVNATTGVTGKIYDKIGYFRPLYYKSNDKLIIKINKKKLYKWLHSGALVIGRLKKYLILI